MTEVGESKKKEISVYSPNGRFKIIYTVCNSRDNWDGSPLLVFDTLSVTERPIFESSTNERIIDLKMANTWLLFASRESGTTICVQLYSINLGTTCSLDFEWLRKIDLDPVEKKYGRNWVESVTGQLIVKNKTHETDETDEIASSVIKQRKRKREVKKVEDKKDTFNVDFTLKTTIYSAIIIDLTKKDQPGSSWTLDPIKSHVYTRDFVKHAKYARLLDVSSRGGFSETAKKDVP